MRLAWISARTCSSSASGLTDSTWGRSLNESSNFVQVTGPHSIAVRTYERGVEGETLACGSGVVASAIVSARQELVSPPVVCTTRSGVAFTVSFVERGGSIVEASLTGDAREIFEAELNEEAFT